MNPQHRILLAEIRKHAVPGRRTQSDSYLSSGHRYYNVTVPIRRMLAKNWLKANRAMAQDEFLATLDSLYRGQSHEEKTLASILLAASASRRRDIDTRTIDGWLDHLSGWAEIDSLCQNVFSDGEMLANWRAWDCLVRKLSRDSNINKRRAALVFLTRPSEKSDDSRISSLALATIDLLKDEREIIITKAISWLLRSLVRRNKQKVTAYIRANREALPKVAIRETLTKLKTGRKNPPRHTSAG